MSDTKGGAARPSVKKGNTAVSSGELLMHVYGGVCLVVLGLIVMALLSGLDQYLAASVGNMASGFWRFVMGGLGLVIDGFKVISLAFCVLGGVAGTVSGLILVKRNCGRDLFGMTHLFPVWADGEV